jgi:type I restriction enzyme S subunit
MANINATKIQSMSLPLPPLPEQHKIVEILEDHLSRLDAALADVKQAKLKAAQFRRSLLQAAFTGNLGSDGTRLMTEIPNGWKSCTLADIAKWGSGGTPTAGNKSFYDGDIPWAIIGDLNDGVVTTTARTITNKGLESSSAKMVPTGAVLVAMYGSIGKLGIAGIPLATNQAIAFAIPNESLITQKYLFYFLWSQREKLLWSGKGATQQNISQTILKAWKIPLPPLPEQHKIVEILEDHLSRLDASIALADAMEKQSAGLRRSLLQAAFTGQLTKEVASV